MREQPFRFARWLATKTAWEERRLSETHPGLAFFAPDFTEISTIKRVAEFRDNGMAPLVLGFRRDRCNRDFEPTWPHLLLGRTRDGRHWQRVWALARAVPKLLRARAALRQAPIYYARNLDLLLVAFLARLLFNPEAVVAYEVLDIQPAFLGGGWRAALLRRVERLCLDHVVLLVLSSPGFLRHYYRDRQAYGGRWLLVENKLHRSALAHLPPVAAPRRAAAPARWVVGYCGLIRGEATMRLVRAVAARLPGTIIFRFAGVFTTVEERRFHALFADLANVVYDGEYAHPQDLGAIYGGVDLAWAIDLEDSAYNSRWLLPNRFYEAGLCGVPCLAVAGFELGALVDRLGVGWSFSEPLEESLVRFFETLDRSDYEARRRRLGALPRSSFVAGEDVAGLCAALRDAASGTAMAATAQASAPNP
jgi:succinoglycan biosynthesis protein ExoL